MKALIVLALVFSYASARAAHVEWKAPLGDCLPVDLVVDPEGRTFVACQKAFGTAAYIHSYGSGGSLNGTQFIPSTETGGLLPHDLLLHDGLLYLSLTQQSSSGSTSRLIAFDPGTLAAIWETEQPHFVGSTLVALPPGGLWWVGISDARSADIVAHRYDASGAVQASFQYDSGGEDSLGFDRRSGAAGLDSSLFIGGFEQVLHVSAAGALLWEAPFATTAVISNAAGELMATNLRTPEGHTAKFAADGRLLWRIDQGGCALIETPDRGLWIAGTQVTMNPSGWDLRILRVNAQGQLTSQDAYRGPYQDRAVDVGTDAAGHGYVLASSYVKTGWFGTAERYLIMKYDASGQRLWNQFYGIVGLPEALVVTPLGDIYAAGGDGTFLIRE